jgi:hypothetical protein
MSIKYFIGIAHAPIYLWEFSWNFGIFWIFFVPLNIFWVFPEFVLHLKIIPEKI